MRDLINECAEVKLVQELNALSVTFLKFVATEKFIKILEYEYELIDFYHLKKCFVDLRLIPVYGKGSKEYVKEVWFPKVISLGMKYCAFVVPKAALGKMSMNGAHQDANSGSDIEVKHFNLKTSVDRFELNISHS